MKHLVVGTAGHVDHGKTALIGALTGQDTDRLPEEKARGISIDIGFAEFRLPSGRRAAVIDVPGHERFIRNMLAGVAGVDVVLLVVAADEGIMPQTREHLDILHLLEVRRGLVALTKRDLVDEDWLGLVKDEVARAVEGTFLQGAPVIPVSSVTGEGLPRLVAALDELLQVTAARDAQGFERMAVDRVFSRPGFGTVVTGTLLAGTIRAEQRLTILPQGLEARVRGLQVHGQKVDQAEAGQRVAVNLAGVEKEEISRGNVLARPGFLQPTRRLAGALRLLPSARPLKSQTRVHFHTGTSEVLARVTLLDRDELAPGGKAYAQIRTEEPVVVARGDHFILRSYSPVTTVGGGLVVEPLAYYRRFAREGLADLRRKEQGAADELVSGALTAGAAPLAPADLAARTGLPEEVLRPQLEALAGRGEAVPLGEDYFLHRTGYETVGEEVRRVVAEYHRLHPLRIGIPREELRQKVLPKTDSKRFLHLLRRLEADRVVTLDRDRVAGSGRRLTLTPAQQRLRQGLLERFRAGGFSPPSVAEAARGLEDQATPTEEVIQLALEAGELVKVADDLYFGREAVAQAEGLLKNHLRAKGRMSMAEFRDLLTTTRKYAVPLLEYFDAMHLTRRVGDNRMLVER